MVGEIWGIPRIGCWSIVLEVAETQTASNLDGGDCS